MVFIQIAQVLPQAHLLHRHDCLSDPGVLRFDYLQILLPFRIEQTNPVVHRLRPHRAFDSSTICISSRSVSSVPSASRRRYLEWYRSLSVRLKSSRPMLTHLCSLSQSCPAFRSSVYIFARQNSSLFVHALWRRTCISTFTFVPLFSSSAMSRIPCFCLAWRFHKNGVATRTSLISLSGIPSTSLRNCFLTFS